MSIQTRFKDLSKGDVFKVALGDLSSAAKLKNLILVKISTTRATDSDGNQYGLKSLAEVYRLSSSIKESKDWGVFDVLILPENSIRSKALKVFKTEKEALAYVDLNDPDGSKGLIERPIIES